MRLGELEFLLSREDIMKDMEQFLALSREHSDVAAVAHRWARYHQRESDLATAQELLKAAPDDGQIEVHYDPSLHTVMDLIREIRQQGFLAGML